MRKHHKDSKGIVMESAIVKLNGFIVFSAYYMKHRWRYGKITNMQKNIKLKFHVFCENSDKLKVKKTTMVINNQSEFVIEHHIAIEIIIEPT